MAERNVDAAVKRRLQGRAFTRLMRDRGTNKWRLSKETGISYRTLTFWESEEHAPTDALALKAGRALGLIKA